MGRVTRTQPVQWEMAPAGWIEAQFDHRQHQGDVMQQESTDFIVMTMNLRFGLAQDRMNRWELRKSMVSRILGTYPADFLGFQEVNHFQAEHLCRVLKEHNHIGWHNKNVSWWQSNMIFYHNSWTCLEQNHSGIGGTLCDDIVRSQRHSPCMPVYIVDRSRPIYCSQVLLFF
jgi:hypothetical protein